MLYAATTAATMAISTAAPGLRILPMLYRTGWRSRSSR